MLTASIEQIAALRPRCIRVVAGAGWGKSAFVRAYSNVVTDSLAVVECRSVQSLRDFDVAVAEALGTIAVDANEGNVAEAWRAAAAPSVVVFDSTRMLLPVAHAIDRLRELLKTMRDNRNVIICSRVELPIVWSSYFQPHEIATIGPDELAIGRAELGMLFGSLERPPELDEKILAVTRGWPIAVLLMVRLASTGGADAALDELGNAATYGDLHEYVQAEIFSKFSDAELDALCVVAGMEEITLREATLALGRDVESDFIALSGRLRSLIVKRGDQFRAVPLAIAAVEKMQLERLRSVQLEMSRSFAAAGRYVLAAEIALRGGHTARAREYLDASAKPEAHFVPSPRYLATALALSADELARSRNVLPILLGARIPAAVTKELDAKISTRWETLDGTDFAGPTRTTLQIARAALLQFSGRYAEADREARMAERNVGLLEAGSPIVVALSIAFATFNSSRMRLDEAERNWQQSGESVRASQTFYTIERANLDLVTACSTGSRSTLIAAFLSSADEMRQATDETNEPQVQVFLAGAEMCRSGAFPLRDGLLRRTAGTRFGSEAVPAPRSASRTPAPHFDGLYVLVMVDAARKQTDRQLAIDLMRRAIELSDIVGSPYYQVFARVVTAALVPDDRAALLAEAAALPTQPGFHERILEVQRGIVDEDSVFAPLVHNLMGHAVTGDVSRHRVEIMRGMLTAAGADLRLRPRELELLVSLALAPNGMVRETLLDRMWPDQDEATAAGALRSTLHRLRRQFGKADLVERDGNRYKLSSTVAVDIIEAEALYAVARHIDGQIGLPERRRLEEAFEVLALGTPAAYATWSWSASIETRLSDLRHGIGMMLGREDFSNGNFAAAMHWAERLVRLDGLDEGAAGLYYHALLQHDGNAEAARWLRGYRQQLATEYGVEASFEIERLTEERRSS